MLVGAFVESFRATRIKGNRLDRNFAAMTDAEIQNYKDKGIHGTTAGLLYNLVLTNDEKTFITDQAVNTAHAKHEAAVLLGHLRNIKGANGGQDAINAAIGNGTTTAEQLAILKEFSNAESKSPKGLAWNRANSDDFNTGHDNGEAGLATKILNRVAEMHTNTAAEDAALNDADPTEYRRRFKAAAPGATAGRLDPNSLRRASNEALTADDISDKDYTNNTTIAASGLAADYNDANVITTTKAAAERALRAARLIDHLRLIRRKSVNNNGANDNAGVVNGAIGKFNLTDYNKLYPFKEAHTTSVDSDGGKSWISVNNQLNNIATNVFNRFEDLYVDEFLAAPSTVPGADHDKIDSDNEDAFAVARIKEEMNKPEFVTDSELNTALNKTNWETYIQGAGTENALKTRETEAMNADKANSSGKINNKDRDSGINDKNTETAINAERDRLIKSIDAEKAKEGSGPGPSGPYYPPSDNGDSGGGGSDSGKKPPVGGQDEKKPEGNEPGKDGGTTEESEGDKIVQELSLQSIDSGTVDTIINQLATANTNNGKEEKADLDKVKDILKIVNQAKGKKEYNETAENLHKELKQLQNNSQLVHQLESLKKEVNGAVQHLEKLEKAKLQTQQPSGNW
ncbi:20237_t:CDS:2 [Entrophospora sp. SA101]|nr:13028_t:CDS:2 [Entrophospora sp. SA101]CAJ0747885.1 20237_t:CDS:2 [Entrophospora sp. SA101]